MKRALLLLALCACNPDRATPVEHKDYGCVEVGEEWGYGVRPYVACANVDDNSDRLYFWLDEYLAVLENGSVSPSLEWITTHALPVDAFVFDGSPNYDHPFWEESR